MRIHARVGTHEHEILVDRVDGLYVVEIDGERYEVDAQKLEGDFYSILTGGRSYEVSVEPTDQGYEVRHGATSQRVEFDDPSRRGREGMDSASGPERVVTQMPGKVVRVLVQEGDEVEEGQGVVVVEAMKMENEFAVTRAGTVTSVAVETGQAVEGGTLLVVVE